MSGSSRTLEISTSPHIAGGQSTEVIMRNVCVAALPVTGSAIYAHGLTAILLLLTATASCVLTESMLCRAAARESTVGDWSAGVTGLLYGLTLPPGLPLWMVAVGGVIAIALGKALFGGLGCNVFNPALVGRAILQSAFPVAMTTWSTPFALDRFATVSSSTLTFPLMAPVHDAVTAATPLAAMKFDHQITNSYDLVVGFVSGSTGEGSSILVLLGGAYLVARKMMDWRIPVFIFLTVAILTGIFHGFDPATYPPPEFMLFSGGLCFGAIFMATDMVTSPVTRLGTLIYCVMIGGLVSTIRFWGGLAEGVQYSILFANACVPLVDRVSQPRVYGTRRRSMTS